MLSDYWAHHYYDNPNAQDEIVDESFNLDDELERLELEAQAVDDWEELPINDH